MSEIPERVIVTQLRDGSFECVEENATGSPVVGRGASVLEAVGEWAIQTETVFVRCNPPAVLQEYAIATPYRELAFKKARSRDD